MKKVMLTTLVLTAALLIALPSTAQANLLSNPGFELGSGANADNWIESGEIYRIDWADFWEFSGPGSRWGMHTGNGAPAGETWQEVTGITGGAPYIYKIYGWRDGGEVKTNYYMKLDWYQGTTYLSSDVLNPTLLDTGGKPSASPFVLTATAPGSANKVNVVFGSSGGLNPISKWDEASFDVVPEPASLLLLGTGLVGLLALRKRTVK